VFAGFGAQALGDRIAASGSRVVFATDIIYRKGQDVPLLPIVEDALQVAAGCVERVVVLQRAAGPPAGSHLSWDDFLRGADGQDSGHAVMESNEPAFILATSGTTAKPKLAIHTHGGYQVHVVAMGKWCFGLRPTDVWWAGVEPSRSSA
jgi:acetyl-CoA synthetase